MKIDVTTLSHREVNEKIRAAGECCELIGTMGQRFIAAGSSARKITVQGVPGNAMGAYLNGAEITVLGSAQDAVGDTMNGGKIVIHGSVGDAVGYAMRGGEIYVKGNAGYRAGIHMKEYKEKKPVMVIGGRTGSFLGEYQAGGLIIVLGLHQDGKPVVGNFPATGMHGGKMYLRGDASAIVLPKQVSSRSATDEDIAEALPFIKNYCELFSKNVEDILAGGFTVITPNSKNPYKQMYVQN